MAKIFGRIGDFEEMTIRPGWTTSETTYDKVDLSVRLAPKVRLTYPFIAAAMTSVVGETMALECARNGIMAVVPTQLPIDKAAGIVSGVKRQEVKRGDLEIVNEPEIINFKGTVGDAMATYERAGHSVIPICDRCSELKGLYCHREGIPADAMGVTLAEALENAGDSANPLAGVVKPFSMRSALAGTDYCIDGTAAPEVKERISGSRNRCMPIVDNGGVLRGLAFVYKHDGYAVAGAIHTYNWEERADALVKAGADVIFIDASQGTSDYQLETLRGFKKSYPDVPICAGNVVSGGALKSTSGGPEAVDVYKALTDAGADMIKIGMGSGMICLTTDNRGVGRKILRALHDLSNAREKSGTHVPLIADGGIGTVDPDYDKRAQIKRSMRHDTRSINLSLAFADAVMMGSYFNMFDEAPAPNEPIDGKRYNQSWGEGSFKAQSLARYGLREGVRRAHIEEGIYTLVPSIGRLKPGIERSALGVAMTLSNVGAHDLSEYRQMCMIERS